MVFFCPCIFRHGPANICWYHAFYDMVFYNSAFLYSIKVAALGNCKLHVENDKHRASLSVPKPH